MMMAERAVTFLEREGRSVDLAWARWSAGQAGRDAVAAALTAYQNPDGGFGQALEPDIAAPDSQPFAARLAMRVLLDIGAPATAPIVTQLAAWLEAAQREDGDWHFSPGVYQHQLAPWFAGWTFPSLNPACCLAGAAARLGIGSDRLFARVRALFAERGSLVEVADGEFYALLPYAEYVPWIAQPRQEEFLVALAARVGHDAATGSYPDALHFFEHAGPASGLLAQHLPPNLIATQLDRLEAEQQADGGWPSPYDPIWRSWATAESLAVLRDHGRR